MLPAADEVLLQRLTLRGETAAIDSARAPLKTALEQTTWPATAPGEFLFLRKVTAYGNPREIAARAASNARHLADSAVDGWSDTAPDSLAVGFRSHASLISCLLRDLLQGNAPKRWYWRRWQRVLQLPTDEAIVTLLKDAPLHLPAVLAQLRSTLVWKPFWQHLGSSGAEELLAIAAQTTGWSGAIQTAHTTKDTAAEDEGTAAAVTSNIVPLFDLTFLSCGDSDSRPLLAALLTLWQQAPTLLSQESGAVQLRRLARTIAGESPDTNRQHHGPDGLKRNPGEMRPNPIESNVNDQTQIPTASSFSKEGKRAYTVDVDPGRHMEPRTSPPSKKGTQNAGIKGREGFNESSPANASTQPYKTSSLHESESTDEHTNLEQPLANSFITHQGGLLYLLNFLNLSSVRVQLPADLPGAGWRWLCDLATALGSAPEEGLLEFMAHECGMKNGVELARQPTVAPVEQLLRLGAGRYGNEVWQAKTWRIPARLIASASHVDLHFRLNDASLAVRRVGLDVNPGWLPWLGRVVTIHYGSGLEPGR